MKYEYGVEYATSFNNPELPDDVMVEARYMDGQWHPCGADRVDNFLWLSFSHFRIVDERYKLKEKPNALTSETSLTHNWFERGELPPVGARFEAYFEGDDKPKWNAGIVAYRSDEHVILKFDDGDENYYETIRLKKIAKFRKEKTEREKAIEAATKVYDEKKCFSAESFAGELYDAGLLRLPEGK